MDPKAFQAKRSLRGMEIVKDDCNLDDDLLEDEVEEEDNGGFGFVDDEKKKEVISTVYGKRGICGGGASPPSCQAENCGVDLSHAKRYHRRHKVCEIHAKAPAVLVAGLRQRFCQQCSRFHELAEFDEAKRSCRRRLAGHNERRRKSSSGELYGEGSSRKGSFGSQCKQSDERGKYHSNIATPPNSTYKRTYN